MNTQILEYMIAISEEKSLSRAADRLLVTQPALSQQLKKLEQELGAKLFFREKNELVLTDAGKIYINGARLALSLYSSALAEIKKIRFSGKKQISMVYNNALLPVFTTKILPAFAELHQDTFISSIYGNASIAKDYLTNNMADIAILATTEMTHSFLEYIPLYEGELMLVLPEDHPCVPVFQKEGVNFQLLKKDLFILNQANSHFRTMEKEIFNSHQFTPNVLCEISDLEASRHMVINQKGITFLPRSMSADGCCCFSLNPPAVFHVVIAYHKAIQLSKPMRSLIMLLLKTYDPASL